MAQFINPCGPSPAPCRTPVYPLFDTGISVRQVPLCGSPVCDCDTPSYGRARIALGTVDRTHWLEGWIYTQLTTRGSVECNGSPTGRREGGWWADSFRQGGGFRTGSKLWSLQWSFVTNEALILAKAYASEALQYLVAWGIASKIRIEANYVSKRVMRLAVSVTGPSLAQAGVTIDGLALPAGGWAWGERQPEGTGPSARVGIDQQRWA